MKGRFAAAQFWNPPADPFSYGRVARTFLPLDAGGTDRGGPGERLFDLYRIAQIPVSALIGIPPEMHPQARSMLRTFAAGGLGVAFVEWPTPRERIQRGLYQDVTRELVAKLGEYTNGLERLRALVSQTNGRPAEVGPAIREDVKRHAAGRAQNDDITLMVFGRVNGSR